MASNRRQFLSAAEAFAAIYASEDEEVSDSSGSEYQPGTPGSDTDIEQTIQEEANSQHTGSFTVELEEKINNNTTSTRTTPTNSSQASFEHQPKKRKRNETRWARSERKRLRNLGEEYVTRKGVTVPQKLQKHVTCKCRNMCGEKLPVETRLNIFKEFNSIGNWNQQTQFILSSAMVVAVKSRQTNNPNPRRNNSRVFYLTDRKVRVCKAVFLSCLGITNKRLHYALTNKAAADTMMSMSDSRGHKQPSNKTPDSVVKIIKDHIKSFPNYVSHYGRSESGRTYLSPELSISKMYQLYIIFCQQRNETPASLWVYQNIFNLNFNFHFYKPKKDTCKHCDVFQAKLITELDTEEKTQIELLRDQHQFRGRLAHEELKRDTERSKTDESLRVLTFDLERTLPTPYLNTNEVFYLRQMWTYNLGIHEYPQNRGFMNMWSEVDGKRCSVEVASCLFDHFLSLSNDTKHIVTYSDSCGGQNRNFPIAMFMIYAVNKIENLESIEMKFMESGHSFLPNDTDFGSVSRAQKKTTSIYTPQEWEDLVKRANTKKRFMVIHKYRSDFKDWKSLDSIMINRKKNKDGDTVRWLDIKWMKFVKGSLSMMYCDKLNNEHFKTVDFQRNRRALDTSAQSLIDIEVPHAYTNQIPLKKEKYDDLMKLLKYIPPIHHDYYLSLPHISQKSNEVEDHPDILVDN